MIQYITTILILILTAVTLGSPQNIFPSEQHETVIEHWEIFNNDLAISNYSTPKTKPDYIIGKQELRTREINSSGIHWYRTVLFFPEPLASTEGLTISIPALQDAYELYWDGKLTGLTGRVGSKETYQTGKSGRHFYLSPQQCSTGEHVLAIRVANYSNNTGSLTFPIAIGRSEELRQIQLNRFSLSIFLAGIFTVTALFHLFSIDNRKRRHTHILFSLFAISCTGHIAVYTVIFFGGIPLNHLQHLAIAGDLFWFGMIALLPIFLLSHFAAFGRKITRTIIVVLSITVVILPRLALYNILPVRFLPALHDLNLFYAYISVLSAIAVTAGALVRKRKGSRTILIGMTVFLIGLIVTTLFNIANGWSVGFAFLNVFITIALSRQFAEERKQFYKSELRASRLELELLKGHLQPHFLLNSLNSIVAWIEEEPAVAARLVNALSQELRLLLAYAGERKINLSQEIKICKIHLKVMNMRQEKNYSMIVKGEREGIEIPPFILHTVIENGVSHGFRKKDDGVFTLTVERSNDQILMTMHNNGDNRSRTATGEGKGTGIRYIRSRLQELYGTKYSFLTYSVDDGWETKISIPQGSVV